MLRAKQLVLSTRIVIQERTARVRKVGRTMGPTRSNVRRTSKTKLDAKDVLKKIHHQPTNHLS
uniref:Uncharacterized protein n=1 Tax=Lutzomyia longipalpis TaxID=7200 RepID=A0A1B0CSL3_LUTLO